MLSSFRDHLFLQRTLKGIEYRYPALFTINTQRHEFCRSFLRGTPTCGTTVAAVVVVAGAERMLEYTLDVVKLEPGDTKCSTEKTAPKENKGISSRYLK